MQSLLPNGTQDVSICRPISEGKNAPKYKVSCLNINLLQIIPSYKHTFVAIFLLLCNTEELSCAEETDEYSVVWPASAANTNITLSCPGGTGTNMSFLHMYSTLCLSGSATRFCDDFGRWEPPNVRGCRSYEYIVIAGEVFM